MNTQTSQSAPLLTSIPDSSKRRILVKVDKKCAGHPQNKSPKAATEHIVALDLAIGAIVDSNEGTEAETTKIGLFQRKSLQNLRLMIYS